MRWEGWVLSLAAECVRVRVVFVLVYCAEFFVGAFTVSFGPGDVIEELHGYCVGSFEDDVIVDGEHMLFLKFLEVAHVRELVDGAGGADAEEDGTVGRSVGSGGGGGRGTVGEDFVDDFPDRVTSGEVHIQWGETA